MLNRLLLRLRLPVFSYVILIVHRLIVPLFRRRTFPARLQSKRHGPGSRNAVPGTGTFVWWKNQIDPTIRFGIPMGCWRSLDGKCDENNQMEPDILVKNQTEIMATGRDQQVEAAVKELMKRKL